MLRDAKADLTAFADFPHAHWRRIWSTNPIERLNREVKRRTDVVGIFPNNDALLRLSACVLIEAPDERQDSDRRYLIGESMALLKPPAPTALQPRRNQQSEVMDQPALQTAWPRSPRSNTRRATPRHGTSPGREKGLPRLRPTTRAPDEGPPNRAQQQRPRSAGSPQEVEQSAESPQ
jgi:hypothetical protein